MNHKTTSLSLIAIATLASPLLSHPVNAQTVTRTRDHRTQTISLQKTKTFNGIPIFGSQVSGQLQSPQSGKNYRIPLTVEGKLEVVLKSNNNLDIVLYVDNGDGRPGAGDTQVQSKSAGGDRRSVVVNNAKPGNYFVTVSFKGTSKPTTNYNLFVQNLPKLIFQPPRLGLPELMRKL